MAKTFVRLALLGSALALSGVAHAEDPPPPPPAVVTHPTAPPPTEEDDLPVPTLTIDRIPPSTSYEFAIQMSFGQVAYFRDAVPPWIGFGVRTGWGKNLGNHRLGLAATLTAEGDILLHTQLGIEPALAWDYVSGRGVLLGLGVGPAAVWTLRNDTVHGEYGFNVAPSVAARIGWSQTWSRVGRRLFVFLEPKARLVDGQLSPVVALAVGSGQGR